jgi:hypothetical protein
MTVSRETILSGILIAGAIVAHGYIIRTPRYQFMQSLHDAKQIVRGDMRTGGTTICEWNFSQKDDTEFYKCPAGVAPAK